MGRPRPPSEAGRDSGVKTSGAGDAKKASRAPASADASRVSRGEGRGTYNLTHLGELNGRLGENWRQRMCEERQKIDSEGAGIAG